MMPQYRCMESYPFQRNQTPFTPYQAFPTPMPMDPAKPGAIYEPWPNGGNYGYPMPCHSCCNHGNFSGYYGFRPYVPAPMPSPVNFCGGYPTPYAEAYPAQYAPSPHYSVDLPRYEYDKNVQKSHHCCGCPHHFYNPKEEKSLKIEEQEPEVVEKKESDSLVPIQMENYPQPVMWFPQEYLHNRGQRKSFEPEVGEQEKVPPKTKQPESLKSCEEEPGIWNGWFPLDMNNFRSLMHGGDGNRTHGQQGKEHQQNKQLPFPVIWMPSYDNKQEEVGKNDNWDMNGAKDQKSDEKKKHFPFPIIWMPPCENKHEEAGKKGNKDVNSNAKYEENPPSTFNIVPEKHPGDGNSTDKSGANGENHAAQCGVEMKKIANLKSIPVKQIDEHEVESSEETKKRGGGVPVSKYSESNARRSSSPPKTPKLPPVCLRVDPLPRKKNGGSRSPSPPSSKGHPQENTNEKAQRDSKSHKSVSSCSKEVEPNEKEKKVIEVATRKISGNDDGDRMDVSQVPINLPMQQPIADVCTELDPVKTMEGGIECQIKEDREASKVSNATAEEADTAKSLRGEGKLENKKTLSDVEAAVAIQSAYRGFDVRRWEPLKKLKQIAEIQEQLVDVRNRILALDSSYDVQNDNKQKVVIGETIMRLLLKLDAIQGLPPSLREIRKSLARELVNLQEKLDSLMVKNFHESETEISTSKTVERIDEEVQNRETNSGPSMEPKDEVVNGELEASPMMVTMTEKAEDASDPNQFVVQVPLAAEDKTDSEIQGTNSEAPHVTCTQTKDIDELPHGLIDNERVTIEFENDKQIEMDKNEALQASKVECTLEGISPTDTDGAMTLGKDAGMPFELVQVPVGITNEDAEVRKHGQAEMEENDDLLVKNKSEGAIDSAPSQVPTEKDKLLNEAAEHVVPEEETEHQEKETVNHVPEPEESRVMVSLEEKGNSEDTAGAKEEPMETNEEANEQLPLMTMEEEGKETHDRRVEGGELEFMENERMQDQEAGFETTKDDEVHVEHLEQEEGESLPASPTYSLVSVDGTGTEFETNKKLKEENEKLKEMMEKLLEAGKEQLDVISNLTVRVKDLEKKLATTRKKKPRTRKVKRSNIPPIKDKGRVVDVAV